MRLFNVVLGLGMLSACGLATAQAPGDANAAKVAAISPEALLCARTPAKCPRFKHVISFPAYSLSQSAAGTFGLHTRGVDWTGRGGTLSLTMRKPKDFTGDRVRLLLFYEVGDDSEGQIQFNITPVSLKHGSGFDTYGSFNTVAIDAPESLTILQERSVIITTGNGLGTVGDWWYFQISRPGNFEGKLRMMSVAVEY